MSLLDATEELLASIDRSIETVTRILNGATSRMRDTRSAMDDSGNQDGVGGANDADSYGDPWDGYGDTWGYYQVDPGSVDFPPMYRDLEPDTQPMLDESTVAPLQLESDEDMTVVIYTPYRNREHDDDDLSSDVETVVEDWIDPNSSPAFYDLIRRQTPYRYERYESDTESESSLYLE